MTAGNALTPLNSRVVVDRARRLTDACHWQGHIPLAFFLIELLAPRRLVELGTWKGDSYCAFCQAIDTLGLDTRATAVDTWRGDVQTGPYGPDVLDELRTYHDPRYGHFSDLLQATFDEGLEHIDDRTVDLLHIDGAHEYDAVKHDLESWLPKLTDRAVVLLHDTHVREPYFGVWRLWEEISGRHPSFAFPHSFGLGVVSMGVRPDQSVVDFLGSAATDGGALARLFAALGERVASQRGEVRYVEQRAEVAQMQFELDAAVKEVATLRAMRTFRYTAPLRALYARVFPSD
ncbi:MAG: group 1 glycosyl transferase [Thermoleophilia bacterium]|nr:group 1 glycosyl transferase [Thermoleophilia bacterium]